MKEEKYFTNLRRKSQNLTFAEYRSYTQLIVHLIVVQVGLRQHEMQLTLPFCGALQNARRRN